MQIDLEFLRRHYASLSDEALLAVDSADLTEAAQQCYDEELARRKLNADGELNVADEPDWLEEAGCACTFPTKQGNQPPQNAENAVDALTAVDIPCRLVLHKTDPPPDPQPWYEYHLMVPGDLNMQALSVLDKEVFNPEVESEWRTYFESLSDEELCAVDTEELFAGMRDRLERATKAYHDALNARSRASD